MKKWGNSLMLILVAVLIGLFIIYLPNRDIIVEDSPQMKDADESIMKSREATTLEVLDNVKKSLPDFAVDVGSMGGDLRIMHHDERIPFEIYLTTADDKVSSNRITIGYQDSSDRPEVLEIGKKLIDAVVIPSSGSEREDINEDVTKITKELFEKAEQESDISETVMIEEDILTVVHSRMEEDKPGMTGSTSPYSVGYWFNYKPGDGEGMSMF